MTLHKQTTDYIALLPAWQRKVCEELRRLIHEAAPDIREEIKFTNRPYFTLNGNVCAFLAAKDHINVFVYDPIAPDPAGLINQGEGNATARSIQIYQDSRIDKVAFINLIKAVVANNKQGGWRNLKK